jgi:putative Holliday junction resolvase
MSTGDNELNNQMNILSIDFGMKRVGFAIGNRLIGTATPLEPVNRKSSKQLVQHIRQLMENYDFSRIVIGYPTHMDGTATAITGEVEHFTRRLEKAFSPAIPIHRVDERLSSFEAQEALRTHPPTGKKQKEVIDSMAAVIILKRFMESTDIVDNGDISR